MTASTHLMFTLPALVVPAALWLIAWGWRGKRLDAHPVCRRCGFDLVGLPLGRRVCSECGSNLNRRRATRFGNRRRRWRAVALGAVPLALCATWFGAIGWVVLRGVDVNQYKPVWWLAMEMDSADPTTRGAALAQVCNRLRTGTLKAGQTAWLVERALRHQRDAARRWTGEWGRFVEDANRLGAVPAADWNAYVREAFASSLVLEARPRVRRGDPLPLRLAWRPGRSGGGLRVTYDADVSVADTRVLPGAGAGTRAGRRHAPGITNDILVNSAACETLDDGAHEAHVLVTPYLTTRARPVPLDPIRLSARFELAPAHEPGVRLIEDESLQAQVEGAIRLEQLARGAGGRGDWLNLELRFGRIGVSVAYDLFIRAGGREWAGPSVCVRRDSTGWVFDQVTVPDLSVTHVDLILRPSLAAAARTIDVEEIWNGEVVFKDVRVR